MDILSSVTINGDLKVVGKLRSDSYYRTNDPIPQIVNMDYTFPVGCLCASTFNGTLNSVFDPNFPPVVTTIDLDTMNYVQMDYKIGNSLPMMKFCPIYFIRTDSSEEKTYRFSIFGVPMKDSDTNGFVIPPPLPPTPIGDQYL